MCFRPDEGAWPLASAQFHFQARIAVIGEVPGGLPATRTQFIDDIGDEVV